MSRMEEWMGCEIAQARASFDGAVQGLLDQATRMSTEEAAALTAAASEDIKTAQSVLHVRGIEGVDSPAVQRRRRSSVLPRDAQLTRARRRLGACACARSARSSR